MIYTLVLLVCVTGSPRPCEVREEMIQDLAIHPVAIIEHLATFASRKAGQLAPGAATDRVSERKSLSKPKQQHGVRRFSCHSKASIVN